MHLHAYIGQHASGDQRKCIDIQQAGLTFIKSSFLNISSKNSFHFHRYTNMSVFENFDPLEINQNVFG